MTIVASIQIDHLPAISISLDAPNRYSVRNNWSRVVGPTLTRTQLVYYLRDFVEAGAPRVQVNKRWGR